MTKLLGLGNKFCIQSKKLNETGFMHMIARFKYNLRVKYYVQILVPNKDQPMPIMHVKSKNNEMPNAAPPIEGSLKRFEQYLQLSFNLRKVNNNTDLKKLQENVF